MNIKFNVVTLNGKELIVRFYPETRAHIVEFEPDLFRTFHQNGLPVPKVIADSRQSIQAPLNYVAYNKIPGVTLASRLEMLSPRAIETISNDIAGILKQFQQFKLDGFGEIKDLHSAQFGHWKSFIEDALQHQNLLPETDTISHLHERLCALSTSPREGLAWGDLSTHNILLDEADQLAGLVDFEGMLAAPDALSLGYLFAMQGNHPLLHSLTKSWGQQAGEISEESIHLFAVLRALRLAPYAKQPMPSGCTRLPLKDFLPGFKKAIELLS